MLKIPIVHGLLTLSPELGTLPALIENRRLAKPQLTGPTIKVTRKKKEIIREPERKEEKEKHQWLHA